jgi:hypothetical protein
MTQSSGVVQPESVTWHSRLAHDPHTVAARPPPGSRRTPLKFITKVHDPVTLSASHRVAIKESPSPMYLMFPAFPGSSESEARVPCH